MVVDLEGNPLPGALVTAFLEPELPAGATVRGRSGRDGTFRLIVRQNTSAIVSAQADGYVPAYYPGVHRWRQAVRVHSIPPGAEIAPQPFPLRPALAGGPYIQAGRVRIADDALDEETSLAAPVLSTRAVAKAHHRRNVPGAFFYLVSGASAAPVDLVLSGEGTGDNGTVILTGLTEGVYYAYADRPGFETAYFGTADGAQTPIILDPDTPGVLADIRIRLSAPSPAADQAPQMVQHLANAPNPFRPHTTIRYELMDPAPVTVTIHDLRGRRVRTLVPTETQATGAHEVPWNATDEQGRRVSAGIYFYRVIAGNQVAGKKMVLLPE
jgi:hypothetical protein